MQSEWVYGAYQYYSGLGVCSAYVPKEPHPADRKYALMAYTLLAVTVIVN